jgi:hypothetical protein
MRSFGKGAEPQIVFDRHFAKQLAPLGDQAHAAPHARLDRKIGEILTIVANAAACWQQPHQSREQRGLAGAVGADHSDDAPAADVEASVPQYRHLAVAHRQAAHLKHAHTALPR